MTGGSSNLGGTSLGSTSLGAHTGALTKELVTLKLRLLRNSLKRSVWQVVGLVLGSVYGLGMVILAVAGLIALRFAPVPDAAAATPLIFAVITVGWIIAPVLLFGTDETLDPSRFALLPVRARDLLPGLTLAGLVGLPGLGTTLFSLGLFGTWSRGVLPLVATAVTVPLGVVLCILWSRTVLTWLAALLAGRRTRDLTVVVFMVVIMGFSLAAQGFGMLTSRTDPAALQAVLHRSGVIAGWTPFGWIWAVSGAVAQGQWLGAGVRLLLSVALAAGLARLWQVRLDAALTSPIESGSGGREVHSGIGRFLPKGPAGAIATRCLLYWRRDPRYLVSVVALIMLPIILAASTLVGNNSSSTFLLFVPLIVSGLGGVGIVSDLAYDNSAVATHVLTGTRGRDDRLGRLLTYLIILVPLTALTTGILFALADVGRWLVPLLGLIVVTLLGGLGAALWVGAVIPGKAPAPGANAFGASSNGSLMAMVAMLLSTAGMLLVSLPTIALAVAGLVAQPWLGWLALPVGALSGVAACWAGVHFGGRTLDRRWPELLAQVSS